MGVKSRNKNGFPIKMIIEVPSQQHMDYVGQALSIVNHLRLGQGHTVKNITEFLTDAVFENCRQIHQAYAQMLQEAQDAVAKDNLSSDTSDSSGEPNLTSSEVTDGTGETV